MFEEILTDELKAKGTITMTTEYAWKYTDAVEVVNYLSQREYVLLGGDVLNSDFSYTYDNWYYSYNHSISLEDNLKWSVLKAIEYVGWYNKKFGDGYYYIIVAADKNEYLRLLAQAKR